jgi:hypothetical protein
MKPYKTLEDLYKSEEFQIYIEQTLGNDLFIRQPDRANRIYNAAEYGCNGSTHEEVIDDYLSFLKTLKVFDPNFNNENEKENCDIEQAVFDLIEKEIEECREWHRKNGSLFNEIG